MKKIILIACFLMLPASVLAANTGWNPKPDGVHAKSPIVPIFLNQTGVDALTPTAGSIVHNTTTDENQWYDGTQWFKFFQEGEDVDFDDITATSISLDAGTGVDPSLNFGGMGIHKFDATNMAHSFAGVDRWFTNTSDFFHIGVERGGIHNAADTSATIATLIPRWSSRTTGIGSAGVGQLSLIAEEVEGARIYKNGVDLKVAVAFSGISSIAADYVMGNFTTDPTFFIVCDAALGNISTTLPPVADKEGRLIELKLVSAANGCYLDGNGAETIDGVSGKAITTQYNVLSLIAGVTEWFIR